MAVSLQIEIICGNIIDSKKFKTLLKRCKNTIDNFEINVGKYDVQTPVIKPDSLTLLVKHQFQYRVIITDYPLEGNYFSHWYNRESNEILISLFQVSEILSNSDVSVEQYLVAGILKGIIAKLYSGRGHSAYDLFSKKSLGYLFDFCEKKSDIVQGLQKMELAGATEVELRNKLDEAICEGFIADFNSIKTTLSDKIKIDLKKQAVGILAGWILGIITTLVFQVIKETNLAL